MRDGHAIRPLRERRGDPLRRLASAPPRRALCTCSAARHPPTMFGTTGPCPVPGPRPLVRAYVVVCPTARGRRNLPIWRRRAIPVRIRSRASRRSRWGSRPLSRRRPRGRQTHGGACGVTAGAATGAEERRWRWSGGGGRGEAVAVERRRWSGGGGAAAVERWRWSGGGGAAAVDLAATGKMLGKFLFYFTRKHGGLTHASQM